MKKSFKLLMAMLLVLCLVSPSLAAVGIRVGNTHQGTATDLKFQSNTGTAISTDGSLWTFNLLTAGIGNSGATSMTTDTNDVPTSYMYVNKSLAANNPAYAVGTLADGYPGQILKITIYNKLGSINWTLTPTTLYHYSSIYFNAVGDSVTLLFLNSTDGWAVIDSNSVSLQY